MRSLRFSIAGLMGVVLLVAIGSAGLANPSAPWAGTLSLLTRGLLCLAVVGAVCRSGAERAWWLGFASFGWIYFGLPVRWYSFSHRLPTHALLAMLGPMIGIPVRDNATWENATDPANVLEHTFFLIGHCLWALLAALLGGFLARALFGAAAGMPEQTSAGSQPAGREARRWWALPSIIVLTGLVSITLIAVASARMDSRLWAGSTYLLTWWLLGLTALGALFGRGRRREFWMGATFFGASFMILVFNRPAYDPHDPQSFLPTVKLVEAMRPCFESVAHGFSGDPDSIPATNARIHKALKQRVAIRFPDGTTLEELLQSVREATRGPNRRVIPIYVDPIGLQEAEKSMESTVTGIDLEGVTLETSLGLCLRQLDLMYTVRDGLLLITSLESEDTLRTSPDDPFQIVGHCLLALMAAALGGAAAPFVCDLARR